MQKGDKKRVVNRLIYVFGERGSIPTIDYNQGDFIFHPMEQSIPPHGTKCSTPWNKQEGAAFMGRRCRLRGAKVPPPWGEGAASVGRRYGLHDPWGLSLSPLGIVPLPPKGCLA